MRLGQDFPQQGGRSGSESYQAWIQIWLWALWTNCFTL